MNIPPPNLNILPPGFNPALPPPNANMGLPPPPSSTMNYAMPGSTSNQNFHSHVMGTYPGQHTVTSTSATNLNVPPPNISSTSIQSSGIMPAYLPHNLNMPPPKPNVNVHPSSTPQQTIQVINYYQTPQSSYTNSSYPNPPISYSSFNNVMPPNYSYAPSSNPTTFQNAPSSSVTPGSNPSSDFNTRNQVQYSHNQSQYSYTTQSNPSTPLQLNVPPPSFPTHVPPPRMNCPPPATPPPSRIKSASPSYQPPPVSQGSRHASQRSYSSTRKTFTTTQDQSGYMKRSPSLPDLVPRSRSSTPKSSGSQSRVRSSESRSQESETERDRLLKNWRSQFCATSEEIQRRLDELASREEKEFWVRSSPAELYYTRTSNNDAESTPRLDALIQVFEEELVNRSDNAKANQKPYNPPPRKRKKRLCRHKSEKCSSSDSSDENFEPEEDCSMEELSKKILHPYRLHADLWHNDPGEMNDGPLCRCSAKSRRTGIRHGIYPGEKGFPKCKDNSNNNGKLYHYRITISPPTNFLTKTPTIIKHDQHEFLFEGFSLLSHTPIGELPTCKVIRFNIEYTILYIEEKMPENFTIRELDLFFKYLFQELLELVDFNILPTNHTDDVCSCFHFFPRFVRDLEDNGKEVLAMCEVLKYLLDSSGPLVDKKTLERMFEISQNEWQDYVDFVKGMVVTNPGRKPCSVRVDQLDRNVSDLPECIDSVDIGIIHPVIVHFGIRPPQLSYAGNPEYQKAWREYVKFRHLVANMSKPSYEDKRKLETKEARLQDMRTQGRMKRNITVAISSKGFYRTGIMCDIVQHAMLIPVLTGHLRFHQALNYLEETINYKFCNRYLLQLALTHPSYKENFGTNPDHARNSLTNCGIRQPEYGDRKIHYMNTRKRGINTLINIMSRFGKEYETDSNITHNERLEFLGDAVVEFLSSIHLFFMFPELEEGGLATYRAAIVQNQHLAVLAKKLHLEEFMLYAHGSDLCHELELRHAMANCFEALMGALLLDGGITVADKVFANALFLENDKLNDVWENYPPHPLQEQEPLGDRQWIESYQLLQNLTKFEDSIGVQFKHIRLLARAFTDRSIGFTHLTLGSNQRLEFLGDTVLQLICSEYLYRHFPEHHEGHLSLLRSSLVNNRTQAVVCDDLGMTQYAVYSNPKAELKTKDRADLLEAFLGALYVDKGLEYCETFCHVCLFPRLQVFIMNQDWNDPKSKLQQCCLTLRTMDGGEPDIPIYKVIESMGPTNTRVYTVAVYFRGKRLASAAGHSIQQAEMNAAKKALENSRELFPQLDHQKRVIAQSIKRQKGRNANIDIKSESNSPPHDSYMLKSAFGGEFDESNLPKQYRMREDISSDELPDEPDDSSSRKSHKSNKKKKQKRHSKHHQHSSSSSSKHKKKYKKRSKSKRREKSDDDASTSDENEVIFLDMTKTEKTPSECSSSSQQVTTLSKKIESFEKKYTSFTVIETEELSSSSTVESGEIL